MLANLEYLEEFASENADLPDDLRETVTTSQACLQHMMTLVRNLTDITRMEDPGLRPSPVATDVARIMTALVREYRPLHDRGAVSVQLDCPESLRTEIDPLLLKRIAHNLLANARRFVDKNGAVRVTARLEPGASSGQELVVAVANSGPAIAPERRPTLFDKYRVNPDGRLARGTGLYFCRLACEAHGGSIALSEDSEFPTVFTVRLPCGPRPAGSPGAS
jgi:signal transduction histidine kinase